MVVAAAALAASAALAGGAYADNGPGHDRIVSAVPSPNTPAANNGVVYTFTQVGNMMFAGGTFTSVTSQGTCQTAQARSFLIGFDASSGQLSSTFKPTLNGAVQQLQPGPTAGTVYAAGNFTNVNGTSMSHVVLLNTSDGSIVNGWHPATTNGVINDIGRIGNRLYIGGNFTTAGGAPHGGLATLDASNGTLDPFMNIQLSQRHNDTGSGAQGAVGTKALDINDQGDRLVVLGNFKKAANAPGQPVQSRDQLMMVDIDGSSATIDPTWATTRYTPYCFNWAYDSYVRDVEFSPNGNWFVVTATGGHNGGTLCDTAARFETYATGTTIQPTWVDDTGGDTLWSNDITEQAVYVGGHNRWLNNPNGSDAAKPGAVARPGIAALDPRTGVPLAWNPGRNPRGAAAYVMYATPSGLWVGSDTDWIGNHLYKRPKIAFFPLSGGQPLASDAQQGLPGTVYLAGRFSGTTNALRTTSFNGTTAGAVQNQSVPANFNLANVRGGFLLGNTLYYGQSDGSMYKRSFSGGTFGSTATALNPYHDPLWMNVDNGSGGTYDGSTSDLYPQISSLTGMFYADGRIYYTRSNSSTLLSRGFSPDSGIVGTPTTDVSNGINWSGTQGMFFAGGRVYRVLSTGQLVSYALTNGVPVGPASPATGTDWPSRLMFVDAGTAPPPPNQAPVAKFTSDCSSGTGCDFDGTSSTDDSGVTGYDWDFGDGSAHDTTSGAKVSHPYAPGSYDVTLKVRDAQGLTNSVTQTVKVGSVTPPPGDVTSHGQTATSTSSKTPSVNLPSGVQAGDQLFLTGTYNTNPVTVTNPSGWTLVNSATNTNSGMSSYLWTKTAIASDASAKVTTTLGAVAKASLTALAYSGVDNAAPVVGTASGNDSGTASHLSPSLTTSEPSYVVESWQVKSPSTVSWTAPSGTTSLIQTTGSGAGETSVLDADSAAVLDAGSVGGHTATSNPSTTKGIAWTIALRPAS